MSAAGNHRLRHQRVIGHRDRPAARVAAESGKSCQLLQVGAGNTRLVVQHPYRGCLRIGIFGDADIAAGKRRHAGKRRVVAFEQRDMQAAVPEGHQDNVDSADDVVQELALAEKRNMLARKNRG